MFDIISSGKNTQWHSFPILHTKSSYSHIANESIDFQLVAGRNCFLEVNKKSGFELLRTINKNGTDSIQRMLKRNMSDLQCGAPSKMYGNEVALGLSTGFIRIYSLDHNELMPIKLKPDKVGNSVACLDYSNCDEHLAALYDSGDICLYGLKTSVKTDVYHFDGASTIMRFHPNRRFALAIASYNGAVTMFDIQTKKKLFFDKSAHASPTRDIAMSIASADVFLSCGFDCNINVYDLRKRSMVQQYTQSHPLSSIALSPCANYCVAGNLKGDIISYDFRQMKEPLDSKRAHDSSVVRVAFVPIVGESNATIDRMVENMSETNSKVSPLAAPAVSRVESTESFTKFIDLCINGDQLNRGSPTGKRDSFFDLMPTQNLHDFSIDTATASPPRLSLGVEHQELRLKRRSRVSLNSSILSDIQPVGPRRDSLTAIDEEKAIATTSAIPSCPKRSRLTVPDPSAFHNELAEIEEEEKIDVNTPVDARTRNKENRQSNQQDIETFSKFIKGSHVSTPNSLMFKGKTDGDALNMSALRQMLSEIVEEKMNIVEENIVRRTSVRIREAESEINFYQDRYFHSGFAGNFNLNVKTEKEIDGLKEGMENIEEALAIMLRDDAIAKEYFRLQEENQELKRRLEEK